MTTNGQMTIDEVYKYLRLLKSRYRQANRQQKGILLDEMVRGTGQHRRGRERGHTYKSNVDVALRVLWGRATTTSVRNGCNRIQCRWRNT